MTGKPEFNLLNNHKKFFISQVWRVPRQGWEAVAAPPQLLAIGQLLSPAQGWVAQSQLGWQFSAPQPRSLGSNRIAYVRGVNPQLKVSPLHVNARKIIGWYSL